MVVKGGGVRYVRYGFAVLLLLDQKSRSNSRKGGRVLFFDNVLRRVYATLLRAAASLDQKLNPGTDL